MDELFRKQDLISAAHLDKLRLEMTAGLLMRLLNVNKLNQCILISITKKALILLRPP